MAVRQHAVSGGCGAAAAKHRQRLCRPNNCNGTQQAVAGHRQQRHRSAGAADSIRSLLLVTSHGVTQPTEPSCAGGGTEGRVTRLSSAADGLRRRRPVAGGPACAGPRLSRLLPAAATAQEASPTAVWRRRRRCSHAAPATAPPAGRRRRSSSGGDGIQPAAARHRQQPLPPVAPAAPVRRLW
jgi:hypothetical protein